MDNDSKRKIITDIIHDKGGNEEVATTLIENNPALLELSEEELRKHIFLVMNNQIVYAVLFIIGDDLFWTVTDKNKCSTLLKHNEASLDYVIVLMLESVNKYEQIVSSHKEKRTLEENVNHYSLVKKNEKSYHIK